MNNVNSVNYGKPETLFAQGVRYYNGNGVARNYTEAFKCFLKAAEQGHVSSQFNVGIMYYNGLGTNQNYAAAFMWFRRAAKQGHPEAKRMMKESVCANNGFHWDPVVVAKFIGVVLGVLAGIFVVIAFF
ncbi:sel1 repeat family protein [bacterium]|nr:sel1 repeat family protein [bacterium]